MGQAALIENLITKIYVDRWSVGSRIDVSDLGQQWRKLLQLEAEQADEKKIPVPDRWLLQRYPDWRKFIDRLSSEYSSKLCDTDRARKNFLIENVRPLIQWFGGWDIVDNEPSAGGIVGGPSWGSKIVILRNNWLRDLTKKDAEIVDKNVEVVTGEIDHWAGKLGYESGGEWHQTAASVGVSELVFRAGLVASGLIILALIMRR